MQTSILLFWFASLSFRSLGFFYSLAMEHLKPRMHHITEKVQAYLLGPGRNLAQESTVCLNNRISQSGNVLLGKLVGELDDTRIQISIQIFFPPRKLSSFIFAAQQ